MTGIADFIKSASSQLGESEDSTRSATGALLGTLKDQVDGGDFQQLLGAMPGAADLLTSKASEASAGGGGALGGLGSALGGLGGLAGGGGGGMMGMVGALAGTGFSADKIGSLASLFMNFAKQQAGDGLIQKLLSQAPQLAKLL